MAHHVEHVDSIQPVQFPAGTKFKTAYSAMIFIGILTFAVGLFTNPERTWHAYVTGFFYVTSLAIGGLFFTAIQHVSKAGWSATVRRITEAFTAFLPIAFVLGLILLAGGKYLYVWFDKSAMAADHLLAGKASYLNVPFFIIRLVVIFGVWIYFAKKIVGRSLEQDRTGDPMLTVKNLATSVGFLVFFAFSYSFFAVDILMSLDAHWFSTIFGIYTFAGLFQSIMAVAILIALHLMNTGAARGAVTIDHVHDLAKFLKGFTVFWAYIAFSQYLLIWYANLPEETIFYYHRSHGSWALVSISLLIFKFIVPFLALLPRGAKRTPGYLSAVCVLILFMQFVDLHWLVYPNYDDHAVNLGLLEIGMFAGFLGLFLFSVARFFSKNSALATRDPRLNEALNHHVTY